MSEITPDTVRHIAELARIALSEQEIEQLTSELDKIVDSVAKVQEAAGPDIPITSHPVKLTNVLREDVVGETLSLEKALAGAPEHDGSRFKVSAILDEEH